MKNRLPYELVLFDLDGTLVDTAAEISAAVNDTLVYLGFKKVTQARVARWIGHGTRELLVRALHAQGPAGSIMVQEPLHLRRASEVFDAFYFEHCGTLSSLYPHVLESLQTLRDAGIKLGVVTNKEERFARKLLAAHHLDELLDVCIFGDSLPTKKPDPAGVTRCLDTFGLFRSQALFVGDSFIDIATARAAALPIWAVPYGYNAGRPIAASGPDRVIEHIGALV